MPIKIPGQMWCKNGGVGSFNAKSTSKEIVEDRRQTRWDNWY